VLLTNLANRIQPIVRYDLGDSVFVKPDPCPCGNHLPAIELRGVGMMCCVSVPPMVRCWPYLPLAIGSVVEEAPGVHRSQLIQVGPTTIHLRLDPEPGVDVETLWRNVVANLRTYLNAQGLSNVEVVRTNEAPEQSGKSGKFRQVIGVPSVGALTQDSKPQSQWGPA
jgi:phenylacetate-CoA ligase